MNKTATHLLLIAAVGVIGTATAQQAHAADKEKIIVNKQMTRDELRSCMKMADEIKTTAATLDVEKAKLLEDKAKLTGAGGNSEELKAIKAEMDAKLADARALDQESAEHAKRVEAWNAEWKEAQESTMRTAERKRKELEAERKDMDAKMKKLQTERDTRIAAYNAAAERYNARAGTSTADAAAWNKRNEALADKGDDLVDLRSTYAADCAKRKFDERDEIAIKKELGK